MAGWRTLWQRITALFRNRKEKPMQPVTPTHRPWTFMVYMAGDNGKVFDTKTGRIKLMAEMTSAGYQDIFEMGTVGTTDRCAVTCLFDTLDGSYLLEVQRGKGFSDCVVQALPELNTGAPNTLRDFIVRSIRAYPADRYALVIWNHGTGWLDVDHYAAVRAVEDAEYRPHGAIFRTTYRKITEGETTRPIAYDDSSKDFLDTADLRAAFSQAEALTGRRLDLIGMDACLMAMVEGAEELAPHADVFLASQEVEPMDGWPYGPILAALNAEPGMAAADLGKKIVSEFATSYKAATRGGEETVTLSAAGLAQATGTVALCRGLADAILDRREEMLRSLVHKARDAAQKFQDPNYRDLGDFALKLAELTEWEDYPAVTAAGQALYDHLQARTADTPILRVAYRPRYKAATGLSVYLPPSTQSPWQREQAFKIYDGLQFAESARWGELLRWLYGEF